MTYLSAYRDEAGNKSQDLHGSTGNQVGSAGEYFAGLRAPQDSTWDLLEFVSMEVRRGFRNHVRFIGLSKQSNLGNRSHLWESNKASEWILIPEKPTFDFHH